MPALGRLGWELRMTRKCATPPMTCPDCGYIARMGELKPQPNGGRSFRCPGCGCELVPDSALVPLVYPAAPVGAFGLCWAMGLRDGWLALAVLAATPVVWWLMGVVVTANFPPRLVRPREPRPVPSYNPILGPRPVTLGLLDPTPHRSPEPTNDPAPGQGNRGERQDGGVGAP